MYHFPTSSIPTSQLVCLRWVLIGGKSEGWSDYAQRKQWAESVLTLRTLIVIQIPSLLFWASFYSLYWNCISKSVVTSTLPKPMVDSQFSFNMTYWQHATAAGLLLAFEMLFLYLVPRTPYTPLSAFLPAVSSPLLCELFLISVSSAQKFLQFSDLFLIIIRSLSQQFSNMLVSGLFYTLKINKKLKKCFVYEHDTYR